MDKLTIGIVGGGQLGRMLTDAAAKLGFKVVVINPERGSPAAQVGAKEIIGHLYDEKALRTLAEQSDYLTIEIEHLDTTVLNELASLGKIINPAPATIRLVQDKYQQKQFLRDADTPVADFVEISDEASARQALTDFGGAMIIKTRHGAYDGRGNAVVRSPVELKRALTDFSDKALYAEKLVPFTKELAVMIARSQDGEIATYPVVETIHQRNICVEVLAPAAISPAANKQATRIALEVAQHLQGAGVFGIEMFLTDDDQILVNEIAPRVHNSGHYTMEACATSQFEQHIRAVTGMPLGPTKMTVPAAVMVNILGERNGPTEITGLAEAQAILGVSVHLYGKSPTKIDRKMGHVTATGATIEEAGKRARQARAAISV